MTGPLATVVLTGSLVLAGWAAVETARARRVSGAQLLFAAVLELLLLLQAGAALFRLPAAGSSVDTITFVGYLLTTVLLLPVGALWAIGERSRWGNGVLALSGAVVAVLVLRLQQIWGTGG